jgi:hypothetical protein
MHHSLDTSSKQLTCFFNVQKNLSFSLENTINTYIHPNDKKPNRFEPLSSSLNYKVIFPKFNEKDSLNQKNNYSANSSSGYVLNNSLFNSLDKINSTTAVFSLVFLPQGSKQHLNSLNIFSLLPLFHTQSPIVDSPTTDHNRDFENLLFHFTYRSPSPLPSFSIIPQQSPQSLKKSSRLLPNSLFMYSPLFLLCFIHYTNNSISISLISTSPLCTAKLHRKSSITHKKKFFLSSSSIANLLSLIRMARLT